MKKSIKISILSVLGFMAIGTAAMFANNSKESSKALAENDYPVLPLNEYSAPANFAGGGMTYSEGVVNIVSAGYCGVVYTYSAGGSYGYTAKLTSSTAAGSINFSIGDTVAKIGGWQDYGANGGYKVNWGEWGTQLVLSKGGVNLESVSGLSFNTADYNYIEFDMIDVDENSTRVIFKVGGTTFIDYTDTDNPLKPTPVNGVLDSVIWTEWRDVQIYDVTVVDRDIPILRLNAMSDSAPYAGGGDVFAVTIDKTGVSTTAAMYSGAVYTYTGTGAYGYKTKINFGATDCNIFARFVIGDTSPKYGTWQDAGVQNGFLVRWQDWGTTLTLVNGSGTTLATGPASVAASTDYEIEFAIYNYGGGLAQVVFKINGAVGVSALVRGFDFNPTGGCFYNLVYGEYCAFRLSNLYTAAEQSNASDVVDLIDAIGEVAYTDASKNLIETARTAYDALTKIEKSLITDDELKELTDAEAAYAALKAAAELAAAKTAASGELDAIDLTVYRDAQKTQVQGLISDGKTAINASTTADEVATALSNAKAAIALVKTDAEMTADELVEYKTTKKAEIDAYVASIINNYREAEQTQITNGVGSAKTSIDAAADKAAVDTIISGLQTQLATLKTKAQYEAEEQQARIDAVVAKIDAIGEVAYTDGSKVLIDAARTAYDALSDEDKAAFPAAKLTVLTSAETQYAQLKAAAELAAAKTAACNTLDAIDLTVYRTEQKAVVQGLITEGKTAINAATTTDGVATALANAQSAITQVKTDAQMTEEERQAHADAVVAKIDAIGEVTYTTESKALIDDARTAYDALTAEEKALIADAKLKVLTDAEAKYAELKAAAEAAAERQAHADAVVAKIDAIGEVAYTDASKALIDAARTAYDALTAEEKALIADAKLKVLTDAEARYADLKAAAEAAAERQAHADAVVAKIDAIGEVAYTDASKALIDAARSAYDALTTDEKALVPSAKYTALTNAEARYAELKAAAEAAAELEAAKTSAIKQLTDYYNGKDSSKYSEENMKKLTEEFNKGKDAINGAKSVEAVNTALANAKTALDSIEQIQPAKNACGGSVAATSIILSTIALMGAGLLVFKKRKED